jgi:hypothetical protein
MIMIFVGTLCLLGCTMGPSPEARAREIDEEEAAIKRSEEFNRSLPPVP